MTDPIDRERLRELITSAKSPAVSIYLPTLRAGPETQQNPIRFKNLLKTAEKRLAEWEYAGSQADRILKRYLRMVQDGIKPLLGDGKDPLILACVEQIASAYRGTNTYQHLLPEHIQGNPDHLSDDKLWSLAWQVIEPLLQQQEQKALDLYQERSQGPLATDDIRKISRKARQGLVETLFVSLNDRQWGVASADDDQVELHESARPGDRDLLDFAAAATFLHGGAVHGVDPERVPSQTYAAALLRA